MQFLKFLLLFLLLPFFTFSQNNEEAFQLRVQKTNQSLKIDGLLTEEVWAHCDSAHSFWLNAPRDNERAAHSTVVFVTYDDRTLYIGAIMKGPTNYIIQSLKRDSDLGTSDSFGVLLDPVGQKNLGYSFGVNAGGAQTEAMVSAAQGIFVKSVDESWDARWYSAVSRSHDGWSVEMAIPLKSIRFKEGKTDWRINFWRVDSQNNQRHVWTKVPVQFTPTNLGFTGTLLWDYAPVRSGATISFTPYTLSSVSKNFEDKKSTDTHLNIGGDAKIGITPTLNMDLTINPDFSQTDVDQQVTNLSRFSIFFPERRQFFLENADVFTNFSSFPDAPFFSRRIGLDPNGNKVPIAYGARLSGNLDPRWRVGILNMQTRGDSINAAQNYTAASLHRRILKRSTLRAMFLNKQAIENGEFNPKQYGRNATGEFEYISNDGRWIGKMSYTGAFKDQVKNQNQFIVSTIAYNGRNFQTNWEFQNMGTNFSADMGFVSRLNNFDPVSNKIIPVGYTYLSNITDFSIYPKNQKIIKHWWGMENYEWWVQNGKLNEWYNRIRYFVFLRNTSQIKLRFNTNYVNLIFPFQVTEGEPIPVGTYLFRELNLQFNTDLRKRLSYEFFGVYGGFYNGTKTTVRTAVNFRSQPWGNFALGFELNDIHLPEPYNNAQYWLVNPKIQINFSKNLFWTTFLQYNTQIQNFNINSRIQWRYRPMSDLFIVYTDNYITDSAMSPKNRAIVLKLNYFFQL